VYEFYWQCLYAILYTCALWCVKITNLELECMFLCDQVDDVWMTASVLTHLEPGGFLISLYGPEVGMHSV
jgi:hypothetical protein